MKNKRQSEILKIIESTSIETQEELLDALLQRGFSSTQATISRDIKELRIVKRLDGNGAYRYSVSEEPQVTFTERLNNIFYQCLVSIDYAQNIVVLNTLPGLASAACSAMDSMGLSQIVGTIAGDDTAFILMRDTPMAAELCSEIREKLQLYKEMQ